MAFLLARKMLYHLSHPVSSFLCWLFLRSDLILCSGRTAVLFVLLLVAGDGRCAQPLLEIESCKLFAWAAFEQQSSWSQSPEMLELAWATALNKQWGQSFFKSVSDDFIFLLNVMLRFPITLKKNSAPQYDLEITPAVFQPFSLILSHVNFLSSTLLQKKCWIFALTHFTAAWKYYSKEIIGKICKKYWRV
jgi:hypothetical protein